MNMVDTNMVAVIGNLTKDVQLKKTTTGKSVCGFTVAANREYTTPSGEVRKVADYISVVAWGDLAEAAAQELYKGARVFVRGRYTSRSYEAQDGTKRYVTEVQATFIARPLETQKQQTAGGGFAQFGAPQNTPQGNFRQEDIPF